MTPSSHKASKKQPGWLRSLKHEKDLLIPLGRKNKCMDTCYLHLQEFTSLAQGTSVKQHPTDEIFATSLYFPATKMGASRNVVV